MVKLRTESKKETKPFFKNMFSVCQKNVSLCYFGQCKHFRYIEVCYYNLKIDCSSKFEENFVLAVLYAQLIQRLPRIIKLDEKTYIFIFLG